MNRTGINWIARYSLCSWTGISVQFSSTHFCCFIHAFRLTRQPRL